LSAPSPSHAADTAELVAAMFGLVDSLSKVALRPETKTKLKKVREETDKDIKKEAERDKKEEVRFPKLLSQPSFLMRDGMQEAEALEAKKAAKRRAEEDRIAKLSAGDQKKVRGHRRPKKWSFYRSNLQILERERKRSIRKQQSKVAK
jgi:hypothetical protein